MRSERLDFTGLGANAAQRLKLLEFVDKLPVHRTQRSEADIRTFEPLVT